MTTTDTQYIVITTTNYYGPSVKHTILDGASGRQTPVCDTLAEALALAPDQSGPAYLGHNEASHDTSVWEVVRAIDPTDWCGWPAELEDAANAILAEIGRDPEDPEACEDLDFDLPAEAAQRIGMCFVVRDNGDCLLCKRLDD